MPIPKAYRNDPNAPWNDEPAPECPECGAIIHSVESHLDECPEPLPQEDVIEWIDERAQPEYDPVEHKE
jgi:hypothetical protein